MVKNKIKQNIEKTKEYIVLQRDNSYKRLKDIYRLYSLQAKNIDDAWEQVEESISEINSHEWIMSRKEAQYLSNFIKDEIDEHGDDK